MLATVCFVSSASHVCLAALERCGCVQAIFVSCSGVAVFLFAIYPFLFADFVVFI